MWTTVVTFALVASAIYLLSLARSSRKVRLPPGPRGIPIIGNALQLSKDAWLDFEKLKDAYGPLLYLDIVGQSVVILNNADVAVELLSRRSSKYSDRPRLIVASEILLRGMLTPFAREGDASTVSMIMSLTYTLPPLESIQDPRILRIQAFADRLNHAIYPGNFMVEYFPWMLRIPDWATKWKSDAHKFFRDDADFLKLYREAVAQFDKDEQPSFVAYMAAQNHLHNLNELQAAWLAATMYSAGSETTYTTLKWLMVALVRYPDVQKKAQEEFDFVVGRSRPPTFKDYDHLPYIRAIIKEVLRWRPPAPLGFPHLLNEDDWYENHLIPKGTMCFANIWSINRDRDLYGSDAHEFNPDRHLDERRQLRPAFRDFSQQEETHSAFGFGRRDCVGRSVVNASLFIDLASILWATNLKPLLDDQGRTLVPDVDTNSNTAFITLNPLPFKCSIMPRFSEAPFLLQEAISVSGHMP